MQVPVVDKMLKELGIDPESAKGLIASLDPQSEEEASSDTKEADSAPRQENPAPRQQVKPKPVTKPDVPSPIPSPKAKEDDDQV